MKDPDHITESVREPVCADGQNERRNHNKDPYLSDKLISLRKIFKQATTNFPRPSSRRKSAGGSFKDSKGKLFLFKILGAQNMTRSRGGRGRGPTAYKA